MGYLRPGTSSPLAGKIVQLTKEVSVIVAVHRAPAWASLPLLVEAFVLVSANERFMWISIKSG